NSPLKARSKSVRAMLVGGGKNAARSMPVCTKVSQAASIISDVARGIIISRQRIRENILLAPIPATSSELQCSHPDRYCHERGNPDSPPLGFRVALAPSLRGMTIEI